MGSLMFAEHLLPARPCTLRTLFHLILVTLTLSPASGRGTSSPPPRGQGESEMSLTCPRSRLPGTQPESEPALPTPRAHNVIPSAGSQRGLPSSVPAGLAFWELKDQREAEPWLCPLGMSGQLGLWVLSWLRGGGEAKAKTGGSADLHPTQPCMGVEEEWRAVGGNRV